MSCAGAELAAGNPVLACQHRTALRAETFAHLVRNRRRKAHGPACLFPPRSGGDVIADPRAGRRRDRSEKAGSAVAARSGSIKIGSAGTGRER